MANNSTFTFEISLSVLDHLGRHLYRNFATVLGEAISNAWDADAKNVWIYLDEDKRGFWIKDDGIGMNADDFQNKFLKIGYSKRKDRKRSRENNRPFIGRKGIGKLALLSCADRVAIISKKRGAKKYVGGTIENRELDKAITDDLNPSEYFLGPINLGTFAKYTKRHPRGTIIRFEGTKDGVRRSFEFLSKIIALYFRFSLLDNKFNIYLDDKLITHKDLAELADRTQFLWRIGKCDDPFIADLERRFAKNTKDHEKRHISLSGTKGFIASVNLPRELKIMTTDERVGVDLFVNGRIRERNILSHIPTARIVENYLYGQVHVNGLDDAKDRFTSSREGIVADDPKYQTFLNNLRDELLKIAEDWDKWRIKHRDEGDSDNPRISKKERASRGLYNAVADQYKSSKKTTRTDVVDAWVDELSEDAAFNFESYAECFVSENLVRKYIDDKNITVSTEAAVEAKKWRDSEEIAKNKGNISIHIHRISNDIGYLGMDYLAALVDKRDPNKEACLHRDAAEYKPMRNAVAHTALLTDAAKKKLTSVSENIKARVKTLLSGKQP
jgi:hypothetical protein